MTSESDKKIVVFYVLKILQEYSDSNHLMSYRQIVDKLNDRYGIRPDVKSIAKNIDTLNEAGYEIIKNGYKGCYLADRDFENGELMYLIDAVNSSNSIAPNQAKDLINKLTRNVSKYDKKKFTSVQKVDILSKSKNKELFYVIELLAEAIEKGKKITFNYNEYKPTKELKQRVAGKEYLINPYFMVNSRGKYYLVCNYDKYNDISNYKIECISNVKILEDNVKNIKTLDNMQNFNVRNYIKEHIYMTFGNSVNATLSLSSQKYINDVIDWFGDDISITFSNDKPIISLKANEQALIYWALQYGEHVEVLSPKKTREKLKNSLLEIIKKYD